MSDPNTSIARTVDNFSGGEHNRSDLAPAIVFLVVVCLLMHMSSFNSC